MSDSTGSPRDPLAALRQRGFLWFSLSRFSSAVAQTGLASVLLWEVYRLNDWPLALAALGLVRFVPQLIAALYAGRSPTPTTARRSCWSPRRSPRPAASCS